MLELKVLQDVDFEWTMHMESVWQDQLYDVPSLNLPLRNEILTEINRLKGDKSMLSPLGTVILGPAGSGKTHLLGAIRKKVAKNNIGFVLADMTDVHDFWETMLSGYLNSLQQPFIDGRYQYRALLERLVFYLKKGKSGRTPLHKQVSQSRAGQKKFTDNLLNRLSQGHLVETRNYQDIVRALVLLNAEDFSVSDIGHGWLQGLGIEEKDKAFFGFRTGQKRPVEIIKGLSWIMSLTGPSVLALDQLDSIVTQYHLASGIAAQDNATEEQRVSYSIIQGIAGGIMALRDVTYRSLILVSCLEPTWEILGQKALRSSIDRYKTPAHLGIIPTAKTAEKIIRLRLHNACCKHKFTPPYASWPFKQKAFDSVKGWMPRRVLQYCDKFRNSCLKNKRITELEAFEPIIANNVVESPGAHQRFNEYIDIQRKRINIAELFDEKNENSLGALLHAACKYLLQENPPPPDIDVALEYATEETKSPPLHARIKVVYGNEGDRESHYCLRVIQKDHANAFRPRLKASLTESGIDRNLSFRQLNIVRSSDLPTAPATQKLIDQFLASGGRFLKPGENDLGVIWAVQRLEKKNDPDFNSWLRSRKPVSELSLMKNALGSLNYASPGIDKKGSAQLNGSIKPVQNPGRKHGSVQNNGDVCEPRLPLGFKFSEGDKGAVLTMPVALLSSHVAVLAGSGSGKTVLIRRLVEESALLGIPSIVIDSAGDLSRLGDRWPQQPIDWDDADVQKAIRYHETTKVKIWTPGLEQGNPLFLQPIPDFAPIRDNPDELDQAIGMTRESLRGIVAPGKSSMAQNKIGVLSAALHYFANQEHSQGLEDFITLLSDLPAEAGGGITNAEKLARAMSDSLKAQLQIDVLLRQNEPLLDPESLFGIDTESQKTTVSVISFTGLPSLESQRQFLNHLSMSLFSWIKKNPSGLRGLLIIDEAKDFIPSGQSTPCKASILRLTAQARKYGLGLIFATQAPKSVDHNIIANCSTQFYGRANSPAAINAILDQIKKQGGSGLDIPKLNPGQFYTYSEGMASPLKILVPFCLSHHPAAPLTELEILERAANSK